MAQPGSDIMTLPAMACSAEAQAGGATSVCSSYSNLTSPSSTSSASSSPAALKSENVGGPELSTGTGSNSSAGGAAVSVASGVGTRRARNFWSVHEDTVLVATIIDNTAFLRGPANTRPRSRFWLHISFELKVRHGLARNKRQCRDRFNLLFWKAVRDHRSSRKDLKRLDRLLAQCLTILYIDKNNVIMLKDQTSSETGAGAAGTPAHNLLHTSDASAAAANAAAHAAAANAAAAAPGLTEDAHVIPPAQQSPLLHQQQLSPAASQASVVGSAGELTDASFDALTDLAAGLQQQVSSLTHRVEELCGMLAMERSRVDYLLSARMGLDSPINAYAPAGLDVPISSSSQYLAMNSPPYLAVASPYMRGGLHH